MGANEENGKRNLKSGTPKKPFIYYYFLVILVVMVLNALVFPMMEHSVEVPYSEFLKELDAGNVKDVYVSNGESQIQFTKKDQKQWNVSYKTGPIPGDDLVGRLQNADVENFTGEIQTKASPLLSFLMSWVAPILMFIVIGNIMGRMLSKRMGGSNAMTFGKSNAKIYAENETGITFADVAGEEEAKDALKEIVDFLHNPQKYADIGANLPKGALLVGPARRSLQEPWQGRPMCPSSPSQVQNSWKCSWAWALPRSGTCLSRPMTRRRVLYLLMKSTPSARSGTAAA